MSVLLTCMFVHCMYVWGLWKLEEGSGSPGTGVMEGCELPHGCWELGTQVLSTSLRYSYHQRHLFSPGADGTLKCKLHSELR